MSPIGTRRRRRRPRSPLRRLRRHPAAYWALTGALALASGAVVFTTIAQAERARDRYGRREHVPVAVADLAPGTVIDPDDLEWEDRPVAVIADTASDDPVGRVVTDTVLASEVVVVARLAPDGLSPTASALPAGTRAVAVPTVLGVPPLESGDLVDLVAAGTAFGVADLTFDPDLPGELASSSLVARGATVVAVADEHITVAVTPTELPDVAEAIALGTVVVALTGESG